MKSQATSPSCSDRGGRLRVYIVEDSPIIVHLLRELLGGKSDLEVIGDAGEASVAVEEITARAPHVAIVDIALHAGNGFDVLRALTAQGDGRPLVMMPSNYATPRYRDEAHKLGADFFFDKNGEIIDLVKTITSLASKAALGRSQLEGAASH